jgi:threonine aldolase
MYNFVNDYSEGCHINILKRLEKENLKQKAGYSMDEISLSVKEKIRTLIGDQKADVHFFVGGTQANSTMIANVLRPYQGVVCAETGHIAEHETGAVEATGHKVLTVESNDGKLKPSLLIELLKEHFDSEISEHMVQPGMVYISDSTEVGTIYKKAEIEEIYKVCQEYDLPLFIDGARIGSALTSKENDIDIKDLPKICDMFYIGGTKNGALLGECAVIVNDRYKKDFRYLLKNRGALMAKGYVIAINFDELFKDDLFFKLATFANEQAQKLGDALSKLNVKMYQKQVTNQVFPILSNKQIAKLAEKYGFETWIKIDDENCAVRFCMSWATIPEKVDELIEDIKKVL